MIIKHRGQRLHNLSLACAPLEALRCLANVFRFAVKVIFAVTRVITDNARPVGLGSRAVLISLFPQVLECRKEHPPLLKVSRLFLIAKYPGSDTLVTISANSPTLPGAIG